MTLATDLARRILQTRYVDLPPEAIHWAKVGLLDTIGCMIAGSRDKSTQIVTRVTTGSSGPSLLFGQDRRVAALDAAQINGTAAHALDLDDCSNTLGGHPSAAVLPALSRHVTCSNRSLVISPTSTTRKRRTRLPLSQRSAG